MVERPKLIFLQGIITVILACQLVNLASQPTVIPREESSSPSTTEPGITSIPSAPAVAPFTDTVLQNAQYHSPDWGDFQLVDGVFYRPPQAPGESAEIYSTRFIKTVAMGDMDADGNDDVLVILATQNGGTGHFVELALVLNQAGIPFNVATVSLGDRVIVESARVENDVIILNLIVQGPNDGLCCPSQPETRRFQLQNDQLIRLP